MDILQQGNDITCLHSLDLIIDENDMDIPLSNPSNHLTHHPRCFHLISHSMEEGGERSGPKIILIGYEYRLRFHGHLPLFHFSYVARMGTSDFLVGETAAPIKEERRMPAGIN